TACDLSDDTILRLANDCPNIVAIKDVTGDMTRCSYLMAHKPDNFMLFSGHDETALAYMMLGGNGLISVASNLRPKLFSKLTKTALNGDYAVARKLNQQLIDLCRICFCESNPIPLKWGLWFEQHLTTAHLRLPLTVLSIEHHERMKQILTKLKE
ncbi:MAG: 4-hydroxy-tetrahydrodipicolinate synthase, partial [Pseudomonadota bacterium]